MKKRYPFPAATLCTLCGLRLRRWYGTMHRGCEKAEATRLVQEAHEAQVAMALPTVVIALPPAIAPVLCAACRHLDVFHASHTPCTGCGVPMTPLPSRWRVVVVDEVGAATGQPGSWYFMSVLNSGK
jgi:hypothetical protein